MKGDNQNRLRTSDFDAVVELLHFEQRTFHVPTTLRLFTGDCSNPHRERSRATGDFPARTRSNSFASIGWFDVPSSPKFAISSIQTKHFFSHRICRLMGNTGGWPARRSNKFSRAQPSLPPSPEDLHGCEQHTASLPRSPQHSRSAIGLLNIVRTWRYVNHQHVEDPHDSSDLKSPPPHTHTTM